MNGQLWGSVSDDDDEKGTKIEELNPSIDEKEFDEISLVDTPRTAKRKMSSPMKMLKKFLITEKVDDDINYEYYGRLCFDFPIQSSLFSATEIALFGKADRYKRPHDVTAALKLAAQKGQLPLFKSSERLGTEILSEALIIELIDIACTNKNDTVAEYLRTTYGQESIHDVMLSGTKRVVL